MSTILITGATGTFGQAFVRRLLQGKDYEKIVVFSRGEHTQAAMAQAIPDVDDRLRFFIGDVRDRDRLRRALTGIDQVVHAAALKRIEVGNYNPQEMVKTNVVGAMNVIEAAVDAGVEKVVMLSTDKAYQPISPYGQSKALAEALFLNANAVRLPTGTRFSVVRYGNIFGASGSVVPRWQEMLAGGAKDLPVTSLQCTRFFMRIEQAVDMVREVLTDMQGGETAIPDLPAYTLGDLIAAMDATPRVVGLPAWEKLHESMDRDRCSKDAVMMSPRRLKSELEALT